MKTYEEVGQSAELNPNTLIRYVTYMRLRWGEPKDEEVKCQVGYAQEWANRFKMGMEYQASDMYGKKVLEEMDINPNQAR